MAPLRHSPPLRSSPAFSAKPEETSPAWRHRHRRDVTVDVKKLEENVIENGGLTMENGNKHWKLVFFHGGFMDNGILWDLHTFTLW